MGQVLDLTGERYGKLTVIEFAGVRNHKAEWLCKCDCGATLAVRANSLRSGNTTSCGCVGREKASERLRANLIGERFYMLTVEDEVGRDSDGSILWRCKCDCGGTTVTCTNSLRSGNTKSCGCLTGRPSGFLDLKGRKFTRLTVDFLCGLSPRGDNVWSCTCDCGKTGIEVTAGNLTSGNTRSCGCYKIDRISETHRTHGMS